MATTCNMTCTVDVGHTIDLIRMLKAYSDQARLTGKCNDFNWFMNDNKLVLRVKNVEIQVIENHTEETEVLQSYPQRIIILDAILRVNSYYQIPENKKAIFVLTNSNTFFTTRLFKSITWHIKPLTANSSVATALVYQSGKIVPLGCKSEDQIERTVNFIVDSFEKNDVEEKRSGQSGKNKKTVSWRIRNIVKSGKLTPRGIKLCLLTKFLQEEKNDIVKHVIYEISLFPSIVCTINDVTCLIFSTSKYILTGSKDHTQMDRAYFLLQSVVKEFDVKAFVDDLISGINFEEV